MRARALFLDRDGVVNVDHDYVHRIEDFEWRPGIFELTRAAHAAGFLIVVVTNQSGIGRGYYTTEQFEALTAWMEARFAAEGGPIARTYHCPYHPEASVDRFRADHPWRKPKPGMILAARDELGIDLQRSVLIGDRWSDMEAGHAAGVGAMALIGPEARRALRTGQRSQARLLDDLPAALRWFEELLAHGDGVAAAQANRT